MFKLLLKRLYSLVSDPSNPLEKLLAFMDMEDRKDTDTRTVKVKLAYTCSQIGKCIRKLEFCNLFQTTKR